MAKPIPVFIFFFLLLLTTVNSDDNTTTTTTAATQEELLTMLQTLKSQGRTLFTNAIATSDLQYNLITAIPTHDAVPSPQPPTPPSFTIFAPTDAPIFSLDMSLTAEAYVSTLKYHVITNNRYTFSDLQNLTSQFLETLLPYHSVLIGKFQNGAASGLFVDGVRVSDPDLFVGPRFAVHGIDGILLTEVSGHGLHHDDQEYGVGEGSNVFSPAEAPWSTFGWNDYRVGSPPAPAPVQVVTGRVGGKINRPSRPRKGRVNKKRKSNNRPVHKSHDL